MVSKFTLLIVFFVFCLTGCNLTSPGTVSTPVSTIDPTLEFIQPTPLQPISPAQTVIVLPTAVPVQQIVLDRAAAVVAALKVKDMVGLADYVHPQLGLRFSPYAAVKDTDQVFPAGKISGLLADSTIYAWGGYSGSGEPIALTFADYYARFIYDVDFANAPQEALNHRLGVSTTLDNIFEFYQSLMYVEFYFPGFDPQFDGMDWRSLRLVFMQDNGTWYLVGIIHDQWTT
jgi:hypothetical protein